MSESIQVFRSAMARSAPLPVRTVGFSAWVLYPPGCAQEGSLFTGFPTWRYRFLKTALRLRPRRALSSAPGQKPNSRLDLNFCTAGFAQLFLHSGSRAVVVVRTAPVIDSSTNCEAGLDYRRIRRNRRWPA